MNGQIAIKKRKEIFIENLSHAGLLIKTTLRVSCSHSVEDVNIGLLKSSAVWTCACTSQRLQEHTAFIFWTEVLVNSYI